MSEKDVAHMLFMKACGFDATEIGAELGYSQSTVYKYTGQVEDRVRAGEDYRVVMREYFITDIFDSEFRNRLANAV